MVNLWAVLAAAVANMVVGSLWYGPLFGKQWKRLQGWSDQDMQNMKMKPAMAMVGGLVTALVMSYVLAHFADVWGTLNAMDAWQLAFWTWLGFVATVQAGSVLWENKPVKLFLLNTSQSLVSLFAMSLILTFWR